jgi:hypothetical protein
VNRREFQKFLDRDKHCPHCGTTDDTLVPNHRANRGMGGHKAGNEPSNIVVLCSSFNGEIESDPLMASAARKFGWKIGRYANPTNVPVFDSVSGRWWRLDNDYGRQIFLGEGAPYGTN